MFKIKSINKFKLVNIHIFPSQHSGTKRETVSVQDKLSMLSLYEKFFGSKKTKHLACFWKHWVLFLASAFLPPLSSVSPE